MAARRPALAAAATWSRISDSSGQTTSVGPAPRSARIAVAPSTPPTCPTRWPGRPAPANRARQGRDRGGLVVAQPGTRAGQGLDDGRDGGIVGGSEGGGWHADQHRAPDGHFPGARRVIHRRCGLDTLDRRFEIPASAGMTAPRTRSQTPRSEVVGESINGCSRAVGGSVSRSSRFTSKPRSNGRSLNTSALDASRSPAEITQAPGHVHRRVEDSHGSAF